MAQSDFSQAFETGAAADFIAALADGKGTYTPSTGSPVSDLNYCIDRDGADERAGERGNRQVQTATIQLATEDVGVAPHIGARFTDAEAIVWAIESVELEAGIAELGVVRTGDVEVASRDHRVGRVIDAGTVLPAAGALTGSRSDFSQAVHDNAAGFITALSDGEGTYTSPAGVATAAVDYCLDRQAVDEVVGDRGAYQEQRGRLQFSTEDVTRPEIGGKFADADSIVWVIETVEIEAEIAYLEVHRASDVEISSADFRADAKGTTGAGLPAAGESWGHTHDDRYYTEAELDGGQLDNRYYTETEIDATYMPLAGGTFTGDVLFENAEQCRFRQTSEYIASGAAGYLDAHFADEDKGMRFYSGANLLLSIRRYGVGVETLARYEAPVGHAFLVAGVPALGLDGSAVTAYRNVVVTSPYYLALRGDLDGGLSILCFGAGDDACMGYDGTNLLVVPNLVGSGKVYIGAAAAAEIAAAKYHVNTAFTEYLSSDAAGYLDAHFSDDDKGMRFYSGANLLFSLSRFSAGSPTITEFLFPTQLRLYHGATVLWTFDAAGLLNYKNIHMFGDNVWSGYGTGAGARNPDATIYYNATNFIIDPDVVGAGKVYIGHLANDEIAAARYHVNTAFTEYFSSDAPGYLDAHAATALRLTTTGTTALTVPANNTLVVGGETEIGEWPGAATFALFGNADLDHSVQANYALLQQNDGSTFLNAASGKLLSLRVANVDVMVVAGTLVGIGQDVLVGTSHRLYLRDTGLSIYSSADSILNYVADGRHEFTGGPVYVGTGTPTQGITGSGDLYVADRIEVDGQAYFDDYLVSELSLLLRAGRQTFADIRGIADDGLHFSIGYGVNLGNRHLLFIDNAALTDDYDHSALSANPTVFVHSVTRAGVATDQWWSIAHDQTNAVYSVGTGIHQFVGGATIGAAATNYTAWSAVGHKTMHGTARVIRHHDIFVNTFKKVVGGAPPGESLEGIFSTADFDAAADEQMYVTFMVPYDWDSTTDVDIIVEWLFDADQADGDKFCRLGAEYKSVATGEAYAGGTVTVTQDSAGHDTGQGTRVMTHFSTGLLAANLNAGETCAVRVFRDADNDDLVGDVRMVMVHPHYVKNSDGQAT